jgi:hypothetical protein
VCKVAALSLAGALCAALGGVLFWAVHGGTSLTRAIAYGCWFAAAVVLAGSLVAGQKLIWQRTSLPAVEGWVFVASACVLTAAGAVVDALGT